MVVDLVGSNLATDAGGFKIDRDHFSERHGLFVIIALGESLIIAAAGLAGRDWTVNLTLFALLSLAFTFGLWWSYFAGTKNRLDSLFESLSESAVANVARDSFSMLHYPDAGWNNLRRGGGRGRHCSSRRAVTYRSAGRSRGWNCVVRCRHGPGAEAGRWWLAPSPDGHDSFNCPGDRVYRRCRCVRDHPDGSGWDDRDWHYRAFSVRGWLASH
ncbi:MAG: hypothetical protein CL901_02385 [Dehalococcoidia bacterium]|nr:hypothetical protein [Dehalococcoidia bacterium]